MKTRTEWSDTIEKLEIIRAKVSRLLANARQCERAGVRIEDAEPGLSAVLRAWFGDAPESPKET